MKRRCRPNWRAGSEDVRVSGALAYLVFLRRDDAKAAPFELVRGDAVDLDALLDSPCRELFVDLHGC